MSDMIARVSFDWVNAKIVLPLTVSGAPAKPFEIPLSRLAPGIVLKLQEVFRGQMDQVTLAGAAGIEPDETADDGDRDVVLVGPARI